jgi:hypothetical protein
MRSDALAVRMRGLRPVARTGHAKSALQCLM